MNNQEQVKRTIFILVFGFIILVILVGLMGPIGIIIGVIAITSLVKRGFFNKIGINKNTNKDINETIVGQFKNMDDVSKRFNNFFKNIMDKKQLFVIVGGVLFLAIIVWAIVIIPAGEIGVYHLFGKVKDSELRSGLHIINPLAKITRMSIRTEEYTMSIAKTEGQKIGDDSITSLTKEGLRIDLDITVLYHLLPEMGSDIYENLGINYQSKIIRPQIRSVIREVVALYEAKEIYSEKRKEVENRIFDNLGEQIEPRGIIVEKVLLRNINLPPKLADAIQQKLEAEQQAQQMEFVLDKEEKEADRKRIEAAGQRDAQTIINESLTSRYLNYLYIKELKDREGTIYVPIDPNSGMPMFRGL